MAQKNRKIFSSNQAPDTTILVEFGHQSNQNTRHEETALYNNLAGLVRAAHPLNNDALDLLLTGSNVQSQIDDFLRWVESLALHWKLINKSKYKYRYKFYGTHDGAISQFVPRASPQIFQSKTLFTSIQKPYGTTNSGEKISKAGREYFHHACKLNLRFIELLQTIHRELTPKFSKPTSLTGFFKQLGLDFDAKKPPKFEAAVLRRVKTEVKHFEICFRIFEESVINTINDTQQEVMERNIDLMCHDIQEENIPPSKKLGVQNQLLDAKGYLLQQANQSQIEVALQFQHTRRPLNALQPNQPSTKVTSGSLSGSQSGTVKSVKKGLFLKKTNGSQGVTTQSGSKIIGCQSPLINGSIETANGKLAPKLITFNRSIDQRNQENPFKNILKNKVSNLLTPNPCNQYDKNVKTSSSVNRQLMFNKPKSRTAATSSTMYSIVEPQNALQYTNKGQVDTDQLSVHNFEHLRSQLLQNLSSIFPNPREDTSSSYDALNVSDGSIGDRNKFVIKSSQIKKYK